MGEEMKTTKEKKRRHRRALWLKSLAKDDPDVKEITDRLDELFDDDEIENAYALTADMMTVSYPFDMCVKNEDDGKELSKRVEDKYGFDMVDTDIVKDILAEFSDRHPDRFTKREDLEE
jgi:hypothetical protein